jgi:cell pole-organizing protein PopZ
MEEILASIRKIISEDSTEPQPAAAAAPQPAVQEADVLELTHEIEEVVPAPAPQPAPVQAAAPAPIPAPEPVRPVQDDVVFQSVEEPPPAKPEAQAPVHSAEGLVSERARSAVDDALSDLDFGADEPHVAQSVAPIDGRSVEAVFDRAVRETFDPVLRAWLHEQTEVIVERMKPAIREWLDDNLPAMLKTAVEAEVARAVKARSTRR